MPELQGTIEEIIFNNEENGFAVAVLDDNKEYHTIVGCMPYIREDQQVKVTGQWVKHPEFGEQLKVESFEEILPNSIKGIERYISSGIIRGIGPVTAKKIIEKFGEKTLDILENDIERLSEIEGIGNKKINIIKDSFAKSRGVKNIMVFLQTYGVTTNQCMKIYKKFGDNSIETVKNNPYILTEEISGIGFKTADKIARSLGVLIDAPYRIQSGIIYVVNDFCSLGNTYIPEDKLNYEASKVLQVSKETVSENLYQCAIDQKLKVENIKDSVSIFSLPYYNAEIGVVKKLIALSLTHYDEITIDKKVEDFEGKNNIRFASSQKEAISGAFVNGVEVITGGPGTGKTTIINCITEIFEEENMRVFMAAPTGRAAKRMSEATNREAKTIHRLLEMGFNEEDDMAFERDDVSALECDVIILDEASMIDILLMNNLLKAVALGTRLIIVGDVDQLPSVGPGNVLRDIIESKSVKVVRLKEIFRQAEKSMIIVNAHKINNGEMPILNEKDKDFYFINAESQEKILSTIIDLINRRLPKFNKSWNRMSDIQILTPVRKGSLGVYNLNNNLQNILNPKGNLKKEKEQKDMIFRIGDKVMQTKNNYSLKWSRGNGEDGEGVYNGDMGFIEDIDEDGSVTVVFDEERKVTYDPVFLDELELSYAITIHKSQGSEFPVVIMPVFPGPPLLMNRNLLYTGITRAKELVVLVGLSKSILTMVNNDKSFERYSALGWRIRSILDSNVAVMESDS